MNFKQKLGYMCIGCLFTLAGYFLASLGNHTQLPNAHAQQNEEVIDEIVCKEIVIVNEDGKEMVYIGQTEAGDAGILLYNKNGKPVGAIATTENGGGRIDLFNDGKPIVAIGPTEVGGSIKIANNYGKKVIDMGASTTSNGMIFVYNKEGKTLVEIGAPDDRPNDGIINIFDFKGEGRSLVK